MLSHAPLSDGEVTRLAAPTHEQATRRYQRRQRASSLLFFLAACLATLFLLDAPAGSSESGALSLSAAIDALPGRGEVARTLGLALAGLLTYLALRARLHAQEPQVAVNEWLVAQRLAPLLPVEITAVDQAASASPEASARLREWQRDPTRRLRLRELDAIQHHLHQQGFAMTVPDIDPLDRLLQDPRA